MQTFLINLDRTPDRLAEFWRINPNLKNVSRFPAVDGSTISREKLIEQNIFAPDVTYSAGAIGCALSHLRLWNTVITSKEPATIAEDDAIFHRDFETLAPSVIATLPPDWDMIVWGWNLDNVMLYDLFPGIGANFVQVGNTIRQNWPAFQSSPLRPNAHKLTACFGTVCYSISPGGAEKLTSLAVPIRRFTLPLPGMKNPLTNYGIDIVLISLYSRINAFVCMPPLVLTVNDIAASTVQRPS